MRQLKNLIAFVSSQRDVGLLIGRIAGGLILLMHGYTKIFEWGFGGTINGFERMGIILPQLFGPLVAVLEFFGGIAIIVGLFTRYLGVLFTIEFIVILLVIRMGGAFGKAELDIAMLALSVLWATQGAGSLSVDTKMRLGD